MSSGVAVSAQSKTVYDEVKKDKKFRYIIYHIKDEKVIEVESTGPRDALYSEFLEKLKTLKDVCRYCVFDFPVGVPVEASGDKSTMSVDRLLLMLWCPEESKTKQKMLYSSSYDALKKALVGVYKYVQACDFDEASEEAIKDHFSRGQK